MPIYTFENNGKSIEHIAPMGTDSVVLDGKRWTRQPVARFGVTGFAREAELVTATTLTTGPFVAITTIAPTTFTSITGGNISGSWSTATIPAGITLPGPITSFQISSGQVVAFNGVINS